MTTTSPVPRVEPRRLRSVLGLLPTGVTLVTSMYDGEPVALVIGSFVSISLDPPLAGFFVDHRSMRWPLIRGAGRFAVNVLGGDQASLCDRFAHRQSGGFHGLAWGLSPLGSPVCRRGGLDRLPSGGHPAGGRPCSGSRPGEPRRARRRPVTAGLLAGFAAWLVV